MTAEVAAEAAVTVQKLTSRTGSSGLDVPVPFAVELAFLALSGATLLVLEEARWQSTEPLALARDGVQFASSKVYS